MPIPYNFGRQVQEYLNHDTLLQRVLWSFGRLVHGTFVFEESKFVSTICIFSALFLPSMGGVERFTDSLAAELVAEGHSVVIVTNNTHGMPDKETLTSGAAVLRLPCVSLLNGRYPVPIRNGRYRELMKHLASIRFDGVLVNTRFYIHSLIGVELAEKQGLRAIVLDHGSAYLTLESKPVDWLIERYEDTITAYLKNRRVDFYGISAKSVEWLEHFGIKAKGIISNSIDAAAYRAQASNRSFRSEYSIGRDELLLAFTGRLISEKGVICLLDMMGKLKNHPVRPVVAGDGPLRDKVESSGLEKVHLAGRLSQQDVEALLLEADLFCLPTRSEGFSTSLLEASSCGLPSLTTDVGGARELIPSSEFGFILKDQSVSAFADIVCRCVRGEFDLQLMGARCLEFLEERHSWSETIRQLRDAFVSAAQ